MLDGAVRFDPAEDLVSRDRSRSAAAMAELFAPLDRLLGCGGGPRLRLNPAPPPKEMGPPAVSLPGHAEFRLLYRDLDFGAGLHARRRCAGSVDAVGHCR